MATRPRKRPAHGAAVGGISKRGWWAHAAMRSGNAAVFVFLTGNFLFIYTNFLGLVHRERWHLLSAVLLTPFYWLLMSVAAARAFGQLVTNPHL